MPGCDVNWGLDLSMREDNYDFGWDLTLTIRLPTVQEESYTTDILAQEEGATHIILTWFCFPSFFKNTESGSSPTSIE